MLKKLLPVIALVLITACATTETAPTQCEGCKEMKQCCCKDAKCDMCKDKKGKKTAKQCPPKETDKQ